MRLVIHIQPDFIFSAHKDSIYRKLKPASCTRSDPNIILAEVDPAEVTEIMQVGVLGWVNALAMKPRRENSRPRRA